MADEVVVLIDIPCQPTVKERDYILDAMADKPGIRDKVQSEGFYVNNVRYIFIRVDEQRLFGKMVRKSPRGVILASSPTDSLSAQNQDGVLCYKFDDHLILGHHIEGTPTVAAAWQLESFSDKLQIAIRAAAGK